VGETNKEKKRRGFSDCKNEKKKKKRERMKGIKYKGIKN
jgi:hypothetical protein